MADIQNTPQADGAAAEQSPAGQKALPWSDADKAVVLNNVITQLVSAGGKSIDWKAISEALPGRTMASLRAVWDRYKNDVKAAAGGEGEFVAVPNKVKKATPRKKAAPKAADGITGTDGTTEEGPETPAKKSGGGRKRATEAEGDEGSAKKKRTPRKTPTKKAAAQPTETTEAEKNNTGEAAAPVTPATRDGVNGDAGMDVTNE